MRIAAATGVACTVLMCATIAHAHLRLEKAGRYEKTSGRDLTRHGDTQKAGPCGISGTPRGDNTYVFRPGETITLAWDEFIPHSGHFRVAIDMDGDNDFVDPPCLGNCDQSGNMNVELNSNQAVIIDGIAPVRYAATDFYCPKCTSVEITLPDVECNNCTLQVMQVMMDKPPYELPGNDLYYQCIDMVISATAPLTDVMDPGNSDPGPNPQPMQPTDPTAPGDTEPPSNGELRGAGCSIGHADQNGLAAILLSGLLGLALLRRRKQ